MTLLKIRSLLDLREIQLGLDISDMRALNAAEIHVLDSEAVDTLIDMLETQITLLYRMIDAHNKHFWPALLNAGEHLIFSSEEVEHYVPGSVEEMQLKLHYSYLSCAETPGAIEAIRLWIHPETPAEGHDADSVFGEKDAVTENETPENRRKSNRMQFS